MRLRAVTIPAVCFGLLACDGATVATNPSPSSSDVEQSILGSILASHNPECQGAGGAVVHYLLTGNAFGNPTWDQMYAEERSRILAQPADARDGLIRADADQAVTRCDAQVDQQRQQAAAAAQRQAAAQLQAQQLATLHQQEKSECEQVLRGKFEQASSDSYDNVSWSDCRGPADQLAANGQTPCDALLPIRFTRGGDIDKSSWQIAYSDGPNCWPPPPG